MESEFDVEFDDREFQIPTVSLPTLESILNEDVESDTEDEHLRVITGQSGPDLQDNVSLSSHGSKYRSLKPKNVTLLEKHGPILKRGVMKGIASQLHNAGSSRVNAGKPTVMSLSDQYIVVGTSLGVTFVFGKFE